MAGNGAEGFRHFADEQDRIRMVPSLGLDCVSEKAAIGFLRIGGALENYRPRSGDDFLDNLHGGAAIGQRAARLASRKLKDATRN